MNTLKHNRNFQLSLVLGATLAFSACSGDGRPLEEAVEASQLNLASLRIVQPTGLLDPLFVNPGEQISFSLLATTEAPAIELPLSATDRRWSVNRPDLASIDENGTFTAIADGEVSVGVRVGGLVGEYTVTIAEGTLTGIDINPERADPLERCLPQTYFATGTFTDTSPAGESARGLLNIDWSTPDPQMGSVSNQLDGTASVTAFNAGMLVLNAEADSASGTANIAVEDNLQSIAISPTTLAVMERSTLQLSATGTYTRDGEEPDSNITESVTWSLPDGDAFASVSNEVPNKGLVTGILQGSTTVTAECGDLPVTKDLVVIENDGSGSNNLAFEFGQVRTISLSQDQSRGVQLNVSTGSDYDEDNAITFDENTTWSVSDGTRFVEFSPVTKALIFPVAEGTAQIRVVVDDPDEEGAVGEADAFQTIIVAP